MHCRVDARQRIRSAKRAVECDGRVEAAQVIEPTDDPTDRWTLELTIAPEAGGVPPQLQAELVPRGLTVRESAPKGVFWRAVITA